MILKLKDFGEADIFQMQENHLLFLLATLLGIPSGSPAFQRLNVT